MNAHAAIVSTLCLASCALAQSAIVVVAHNDPDGIVTPGQTVQITTTISWQVPTLSSALFAIGGDVKATPDVGVASNNLFPIGATPGQNAIINPGTPALGSVAGVYLECTDLPSWILFGQPLLPPWSLSNGLDIVRFDWTAPAALGVVAFEWEPSAALPQPMIGSSSWSPWVQPVPTTYFGTSLTVIPAPPAAAALLAASFLTRARRRP